MCIKKRKVNSFQTLQCDKRVEGTADLFSVVFFLLREARDILNYSWAPMLLTESNLLSCKLFWFLLKHASPFTTWLFTFATACLILDESGYLQAQKNGRREMKGYCLDLISHKRAKCTVPLRAWNFRSCL